MLPITPALLENRLSDISYPFKTVSMGLAEQLFAFFHRHQLFNWKDSHNGCEGRADAICVLLDEWKVPNYKAWVFGGAYLRERHVGELVHAWNYHVAPVLAVHVEGRVIQFVLDPSTAYVLQPVEDWARVITKVPHSYFCVRQSIWYIFPPVKISTASWNTRNRQNRKWMIQSLAGINGLTPMGKARLCFNKQRIKRTAAAFEKAKIQKPSFIL